MNLQSRLSEFLEYKNLTYSQFERRAGMANASATRLQNKSRESTFVKIANAFPELNIEWLRKGEGEMLNYPYQSASNVRGRNICGVNVSGRDIHLACPEVYDTLLNIVNDNREQTEKYQEMVDKYQKQLDKAQQQIDELIAMLKAKV